MVHDSRPTRLVHLAASVSEDIKQQIAKLLHGRLDFVLAEDASKADMTFSSDYGELQLTDNQNRTLKIDFDSNHIDYNRKGHRGKQEIIAKALGASKGVKKILDLTAGLGQDSVFLTQIGFSVKAIERNPLLFLLLQSALDRTHRQDLSDLVFINADAKDFLSTGKANPQFIATMQAVDAIYFDPMYPHKKKSALPRKEMLIFRDLVGDDKDALEVATLAKAALEFGPSRLVIKRPLHAEPLLENPIHSFEGKTVRYDLYSRT